MVYWYLLNILSRVRHIVPIPWNLEKSRILHKNGGRRLTAPAQDRIEGVTIA